MKARRAISALAGTGKYMRVGFVVAGLMVEAACDVEKLLVTVKV